MNDNKETTPLLHCNPSENSVPTTQIDLQTQIQNLQLQIQLQQLQQSQQLQNSLILNIPNNSGQNTKSSSECFCVCCVISTVIFIVLICIGVYFGITTSNGGN